MAYDADSGTVIYRSRMHKTLKRNFQVHVGGRLAGTEWGDGWQEADW